MRKRLIENFNKNMCLSFLLYTLVLLLIMIIIKMETENFILAFGFILIIWLIPIGLTWHRKTRIGKFFNAVMKLHRGEKKLNRIRYEIRVCKKIRGKCLISKRKRNHWNIRKSEKLIRRAKKKFIAHEKKQRKEFWIFCKKYRQLLRFANKFG